MKWFYIVVGVVVLAGGGGFVLYKPRGIRNNNPGNIRHGSPWLGMTQYQPDSDFIKFNSPVYGIRALNKILKTYSTQHKIKTVRGVVSRWAPSNENDTESYVLSVADKLDVQPDQVIDIKNHAPELTTAIIYHENGQQPYSTTVINTGVAMGWA
jgi:hypothetical protein